MFIDLLPTPRMDPRTLSGQIGLTDEMKRLFYPIFRNHLPAPNSSSSLPAEWLPDNAGHPFRTFYDQFFFDLCYLAHNDQSIEQSALTIHPNSFTVHIRIWQLLLGRRTTCVVRR
jgi:hypothetical protein